MKKFKKAIIISIILVAVISIFDFFMYPQSFWLYSYALGAVTALTYYFLIKKDKSESLAIFLAFLIMIWFGLEDLIFYVIRPLFQPEFAWGIPESMPPLFDHPIIGGISKTLGFSTATPVSLVTSVIVGALITYFMIKQLKKL